jgi:hypothetical protein
VRTTAIFFAAALAACATSGTEPTVTFSLAATQRNAGQNGSAIIGPLGDRAAMRIKVTGVPPWVVRPVQLYTFVYAGTCARHAEPPAYALNDVVNAGLFSNNSITGPFFLSKTIPATMASLQSRPHALVIRTSAADGNVDLFCGDLPR